MENKAFSFENQQNKNKKPDENPEFLDSDKKDGLIENKEESKLEDSAGAIMQRILDDYEKLKELKGKKGADELFAKILETSSKEKIIQSAEHTSDIIEAKNIAFEKLQEQGLIRKASEGGWIFDVEEFKSSINSKLLASFGPIYGSKYLGGGNYTKTLAILFEGEKVISEEDYQKEEKEFKSLFYLPKTKEEALDINQIRESEFYLTFKNVTGKVRYDNNDYGFIPKEELSYKEALLPVLIYHPDFGAGYRDSETNRLMVKNNNGQYREISGQYLIDRFGVYGKKACAVTSEYLTKKLPNLEKEKIVTSADFIGQKFGKMTDKYRAFRKISEKGMTMFDGIRYTLGRQFGPRNGNFEACEISSDLGGITSVASDGTRKLEATFQIVKKENSNKTKGGYYTVGVKQACIKSYNKDEIYNKKSEESDEEYKGRIGNYENFNFILEVSDYISEKAEINLTKFSLKEQQMITTVAERTDYQNNDRFIYFVKKYGFSGLKACLSLEYDQNMGGCILEIGEKLKKEPEVALSLFTEYARIVDEAEKNMEELEIMYDEIFLDKQIDQDKSREAISKKGSDLLKKASSQLQDLSDNQKIELTRNLILDLKREESIQKKVIKNFKNLFEKLNKLYEEIKFDDSINEEYDSLEEKDQQTKEWLVENGHENYLEYYEDDKKYDSLKIKRWINELDGDINRWKEKSINNTEKVKVFAREIEIENTKKIKKLEELLAFQTDLENQLNNFVYNENQEVLNPILKTYQEIINLAKTVKKQAKEIFKEDRDFSEEEIDGLMETVLKKAHSLLHNFSDKIAKGEISEKDLITEMESYKTDLIMTASVWKNFKNEIGLGELKGVSFEQDTVENFTRKGEVMNLVSEIYQQNSNGFYDNLSKNDFLQRIKELKSDFSEELVKKASQINQMLEIYKRNYQDRPELQKEIIDDFLEIFQKASSDTNIYLLNKDDDIMGFIRYDKKQDGKTKYAGSFNIDTPLHQLSLGGALFLESLEKESKNYEIVGVCDGFSPANIFYVEQGGYVVEGIDIKDLEKNKFPDFHIRKNNQKYQLRDLSQKDLVSWNDTENSFVEKFSGDDNTVWSELMVLVNKKGFVITRIVRNGNDFYCGFERKAQIKENEEQLDQAA